MPTAQEVYNEWVQGLPLPERLKLASLILDNVNKPGTSLIEFSDSWSEEDLKDMAAYSLEYAADQSDRSGDALDEPR